MVEWLILVFVLTLIYFIMKTPTTPNEKPAPKAKTEQLTDAVAPETKPKTSKPTQKTSGKPQAGTSKTAAKAKTEQPAAAIPAEAKTQKTSPIQRSSKNPTAAPKSVAVTPAMTLPERVGLTAGSIWHYLDDNGATPVAKLVQALPEEEKIIQRSIGWLAQEGKITLNTSDKVETIGLIV